MPSRMRPSSRFLTGVLLALMLALASAALVSAQETTPPPDLEILGAEYDHATGDLQIQLRVGGSRDQLIQDLTVLVDSVPRTVNTQSQDDVSPLTVLLALDTSGSMAGQPLSAAAEAAGELVSKLAEGDSVGLMTFSTAPVLRVSPTTNRDRVTEALANLRASGDTALHDAVVLGLSTLAESDNERRALVLLSDGEDSGVSRASAQDALTAVEQSGVSVYTFAFGEGADAAFLAQLAARGNGSAWAVADDQTLGELFSALGGRLGATRLVQVRASGLAATKHTIEVRARVDGEVVRASTDLEVSPAALTLGDVVAAADQGSLSVAVTGMPVGTNLHATLDGADAGVTVSSAGVSVDVWALEPGDHELAVEAVLGDQVAARGVTTVSVPALQPQLYIDASGAEARTFKASVRYQGKTPPVIVAAAGGEELGRSTEGNLTVTAPDAASEVTFSVLSADGAALASESRALPVLSSEGGGASSVLLIGIVVMAAAGGGLYLWRRRRSNRPRPEPAYRAPLRRLRDVAPPPPAQTDGPTGRLLVTDPSGTTRTVPIGRRPLSVGAAANCDITIGGAGIREQHARIALTQDGTLRIHGLMGGGARPYEGQSVDQWLTLQPGEEVAIGSWSLRLDEHDAADELVEQEGAL